MHEPAYHGLMYVINNCHHDKDAKKTLNILYGDLHIDDSMKRLLAARIGILGHCRAQS